MALYKRGGKWWYEFEVRGQRVRETSNSANKDVAGRLMRERRRDLELSSGGLERIAKPLHFSTAVAAYLLDREPRLVGEDPGDSPEFAYSPGAEVRNNVLVGHRRKGHQSLPAGPTEREGFAAQREH